MTSEVQRDAQATRRTMLAGLGVAGLAGTLAACSSASSTTTPPANTGAGGGGGGAYGGGGAAGGGGSTGGGGSSGGGSMAGHELGSVHEIPVGGGKVFTAHKVVVTQPAKGEFKAFSAVCTHEQCLVDQVADGTIDCPCHGSKFSVKNGHVVAGPAPTPLPRKQIKVKGGKIKMA